MSQPEQNEDDLPPAEQTWFYLFDIFGLWWRVWHLCGEHGTSREGLLLHGTLKRRMQQLINNTHTERCFLCWRYFNIFTMDKRVLRVWRARHVTMRKHLMLPRCIICLPSRVPSLHFPNHKTACGIYIGCKVTVSLSNRSVSESCEARWLRDAVCREVGSNTNFPNQRALSHESNKIRSNDTITPR